MVRDFQGDHVRLRQLGKENEQLKSIAKVHKTITKKLEKDIEKLQGYLADYNKTLKEKE